MDLYCYQSVAYQDPLNTSLCKHIELQKRDTCLTPLYLLARESPIVPQFCAMLTSALACSIYSLTALHLKSQYKLQNNLG